MVAKYGAIGFGYEVPLWDAYRGFQAFPDEQMTRIGMTKVREEWHGS